MPIEPVTPYDRNVILLAFPSVINSRACTIYAGGTEPSDMVASYLKTDEPTDVARILSIDPLKTYWEAIFTTQRSLTGIAAINSNLSPAGFYRFYSSNSGGNHVAANTTYIGSSINMGAGTYTNIDEAISSPDGLYLFPANTTLEWSAMVGFSTPLAVPTTGTARGLIVINVFYAGGTPLSKYPRVQVELYQGAVFQLDLGYRAITSPTSQTFIFDFNPADLANPNCSNLRANVKFQIGSNGTYGRLETVRLYTSSQAFGGEIPLEYDSGYLPSPTLPLARFEGLTPRLSYHYFPTTTWVTLTNLLYSVIDDQVDHDPPMGNSTEGVPVDNVIRPLASGYVETGVLTAGEGLTFTPGITVAEEPTLSVKFHNPTGTPRRTLGGVLFSGLGSAFRGSTPITVRCTRAERDNFLRYVAWQKNNASAFYIALNPDKPLDEQQFDAFWCYLSSDQVDHMKLSGGFDLYSLTFEVTEV